MVEVDDVTYAKFKQILASEGKKIMFTIEKLIEEYVKQNEKN